MAEAAEKQASWTKRQFWVTLAEVAGLLAVVFYSANATRAANRSAKAAEDAVKETRRIGEAQVRAYVQIDSAVVSIKMSPVLDVGFVPEIKIRVINSGSSPARAFRWCVQTIYSYKGARSDLRGEITYGDKNWGKDIAARDATTETISCYTSALNDEDKRAFESGDGFMLVATIYTVFIDVFDKANFANRSFAAYFPSGESGKEVVMHRYPATAADMARLPILGPTTGSTQQNI